MSFLRLTDDAHPDFTSAGFTWAMDAKRARYQFNVSAFVVGVLGVGIAAAALCLNPVIEPPVYSSLIAQGKPVVHDMQAQRWYRAAIGG